MTIILFVSALLAESKQLGEHMETAVVKSYFKKSGEHRATYIEMYILWRDWRL